MRPAVVSPHPRTCEGVSKKPKSRSKAEYSHFKNEQSPKNPLLHVLASASLIASLGPGFLVLGYQFWVISSGLLLRFNFAMFFFLLFFAFHPIFFMSGVW